MHVLIIPSWYKTDENPVLGSFFEEQARGLKSLGCKVGILHIGYKSFSSKAPLLNTRNNDNELYTIQYDVKGVVPRNRYINYMYLGIRSYKIYKEYIRLNGRPDIIHAHSVFWGGIAAYFISKITKIPFVITEHLTSFISGTITNPIDIKFSKKIFNASKKNIVVSNTFKNELSEFLKLPSQNFSVIHNMVSPQFFIDRKPIDIEAGKPIVFFTNSFLTARKNHSLIINAFSLFVKTKPNSILYIGGDATTSENIVYKNSLIKLATDLCLLDKVFFLGALSREEVKEQLDKCHVFLLASLYETFGVVLIEALAAGRPVVSTDSRGPREIITKTNGVLVYDFNDISFCEAMNHIVENYDQYNQSLISDECEMNYSAKTIMNKILNLYNSIIN